MYANHVCTIKTSSYSKLPPLSEDAGWTERICRAFRKTTLVSSNNPSGKIYFRSQAAIAHERRRHINSNLLHIIHPFSELRIYWELWMIVVYLISFICEPFNIAFKLNSVHADSFISWLSTIVDLCWLVDIFMTFFTGYGKSGTKEVVLEPRKIAIRYLKSYFIVDLVAALPYKILKGVYKFNARAFVLLNVTVLIIIFRLKTLLIYLKGAADMWQLSILVFLSLKYLILVILVLHWTACLHYIVPSTLAAINGRLDPNSWINLLELDPNASAWERYLHCFYRACCYIFTVSYGVNYPIATEDFIMGILTYIIGTALSVLLTVLLLQMYNSLFSSETTYYEIMNQVGQYMRYKQLPLNMQQRLISFYQYKFQKKYFHEELISLTLSERLKREINVYCYRRLVDSVSIFKNVPYYILIEIVNSLKCEIYLPNDIIVKAGTIGDCMYFLSSGTVCVLTPSGREVCHLYDGAYFGEIALIMKDPKRVADVIAIEICEVYRLSKKTFKTCFRNNEALYKQIEAIAQDRLEKTKLLEDLHQTYLMALQIDDMDF